MEANLNIDKQDTDADLILLIWEMHPEILENLVVSINNQEHRILKVLPEKVCSCCTILVKNLEDKTLMNYGIKECEVQRNNSDSERTYPYANVKIIRENDEAFDDLLEGLK